MEIGIVTAWFERGSAYVSKTYMELLQFEGHKVYIFARGGENLPETISGKWNGQNVTRSTRFTDTTIEIRKLYRWIRENKIKVILFNEQQDFRILIYLKKYFPDLKLGAYVDYYTERTIPWFNLYDFLVCNTRRHMQAMDMHPQKFYISWGTDISLFSPIINIHDRVVFFHSAGMSTRKGTDILIDAFIDGGVYMKSELVIHTQIPIDKICLYRKEELKKYNISVIEKTVTAPGLYYMGDVYAYPTRLDGLGLTMYEALASGMPMIVSDFPPMNEVGTDAFVRRVKIKDYYCREDGYFFPMVICDKEDLIHALIWYADHPEEVQKQKQLARNYAEKNYDIKNQSTAVSKIFLESKVRPVNKKIANEVKQYYLTQGNIIGWLLKHRVVKESVKKCKAKFLK